MVALALVTPTRIRGCPVTIECEKSSSSELENFELAEAVSRTLEATGYPPLKWLDVSANDTGVTIQGFLPSYFFKQVTLATVLSVPGVHQLRDELEIGSS